VLHEFDKELSRINTSTFLGSVSLHYPQSENQYGRLSMWRAYGGSTGVALIVNPDLFGSEVDMSGVYSTPVKYFSEPDFVQEFEKMVEKLEKVVQFSDPEQVASFSRWLRVFFEGAMISTKHPAFREEREWRIFFNDTANEVEHSPVKKVVETVNGLPQQVIKLSLHEPTRNELWDFSKIFERIIIGPSEHAFTIAQALASELENAEITNPWDRITISNIPLRQN
jgi:Protein of unknown function (DUF2971)